MAPASGPGTIFQNKVISALSVLSSTKAMCPFITEFETVFRGLIFWLFWVFFRQKRQIKIPATYAYFTVDFFQMDSDMQLKHGFQ